MEWMCMECGTDNVSDIGKLPQSVKCKECETENIIYISSSLDIKEAEIRQNVIKDAIDTIKNAVSDIKTHV